MLGSHCYGDIAVPICVPVSPIHAIDLGGARLAAPFFSFYELQLRRLSAWRDDLMLALYRYGDTGVSICVPVTLIPVIDLGDAWKSTPIFSFYSPTKAVPAFMPVPLASGNVAAIRCCMSAPPTALPFPLSPDPARGTAAVQISLSSTSAAFRLPPTVGDRSACSPAWPCAAGTRLFPDGIRCAAHSVPSSGSSDNNRLCWHKPRNLWRVPGTCESPPLRFGFCLDSSTALPADSKSNSRRPQSEIARRKTPASLPTVHSIARPWPRCSSPVQSVPRRWSRSAGCLPD